MKRGMMVVPVLCLVGFSAGCVTMSTEQVDRVDQGQMGNSGYVVGGQAQSVDQPYSDEEESKKRTVSRVDFELMSPKEFWMILAGHPKEEVLYGGVKKRKAAGPESAAMPRDGTGMPRTEFRAGGEAPTQPEWTAAQDVALTAHEMTGPASSGAPAVGGAAQAVDAYRDEYDDEYGEYDEYGEGVEEQFIK